METLNKKPAVRINARYIARYKRKGKISWLFNCEGKQIWFPAKSVKKEASGTTILVEKWLYEDKVEKGEL